MDRSIYGFVFRYSRREQILLLLLTLAAFPFLYMSLDLPKTIINQAISGKGFPKEILGYEFDQIPYLVLLCFIFLGLVLINGWFKYTINTGKGRLGERMLRRLRYELYSRVLRFPLPHFKRVSSGEIIPMITSEVEPLGGFIGDAVAQPVFQAGQLLTIMLFIMIQDPVLGVAAISLYPFQAWLIPKLQRKVNQLAKERVRTVRRLADLTSESIAGVAEIRAHDFSNYQRARITELLGTIYDIRFEIFQRKFFIKFLNNFIAQLTPFFFYLIGGYLVIRGQLSFGALVAVLAAYKEMSAPWKELLAFYQQYMDSRIKYEQVIEQFQPAGMLDEKLQIVEPESVTPFPREAEVVFTNVTYAEEVGRNAVENVSFAFRLDEHLAIVGPEGSGKEETAMLLARLLTPTSGRITVAGTDLALLPEAVIGRRFAYVGQAAHLFSASIRENLLLGLRHRPVCAPATPTPPARRKRSVSEAKLSGNSVDDLAADWIDYAALGIDDPADLDRQVADVLRMVQIDRDIYGFGLRGTIDPEARPELARRILDARRALRLRLADPDCSDLVEPFDPDRYNENASVAENLLFGTPVGPTFSLENIAANTYVRQILDKTGLTAPMIEVGREVAALMVELFGDIDPGQELFERYSFVNAEELADYQAILGRAGRAGRDALKPDDETKLLALVFRLIPARHRLGIMDENKAARLLEARRVFAADLPEDLRPAVEFFDAERYNAAATIQDNILFGKIVHGSAQGPARVRDLIGEIVDELGMREEVVTVGLDYEVGIGGGRLASGQRQKLAIARCILKRPDLLIVNEATAALDHHTRTHILDAVIGAMAGRGLVWALEHPNQAERFDRVLVMRGGRVVEQGSYAELHRDGSGLPGLAAAE